MVSLRLDWTDTFVVLSSSSPTSSITTLPVDVERMVGVGLEVVSNQTPLPRWYGEGGGGMTSPGTTIKVDVSDDIVVMFGVFSSIGSSV